MKNDEATDPPMTPHDDSLVWFETGPGAIRDDPDLAVLMVRVGMATNALLAQFDAVRAVTTPPSARKTRNVLAALVASAALTTESLRIAQENMRRLRELAARTHAKPALFKRIGRLCAGKHAASAFLEAARNKLGFHWDKEMVEPCVKGFGKNQRLVWLEADTDSHPVHRLAFEVLVHALIPAANVTDETESRHAVTEALEQVSDAMNIVIEFFLASTYGYLSLVSAARRGKNVRGATRVTNFAGNWDDVCSHCGLKQEMHRLVIGEVDGEILETSNALRTGERETPPNCNISGAHYKAVRAALLDSGSVGNSRSGVHESSRRCRGFRDSPTEVGARIR